MNRAHCFVLAALLSFAPALAAKDVPEIGGWRETLLSVRDLAGWEQVMIEVGGWEVMSRGQADARLHAAWELPADASIDEVLMRNPGTATGYIRFLRFNNVEQQQMRSNGQTWETGGIFDINVRVTDLAARFAELQARDWQSFGDPVRFTFGPFVVREWLGRGPDGIVFALIQRDAPPLEGWPHLKRFSRSFNSTQIVRDMQASLHFYTDVLGFKLYVETQGPSDTPGPNVLGLPHNLVTEISRHTVIVHPTGENEGSVELIEFDGLTGRDFAPLAKPPNLGVLALRFPVKGLDTLATKLEASGFEPQARARVSITPYGEVELLAIIGPNGEWLEFYE